ncbi:hypothetical protein [Saccharothrix australiensis]|uniref:hypothetical protein n=1 Tax=Saccharothrix australiensis TaxID=2072 RepID=UPI0011C43E09|nr:hypothetical protein [Saccharothrix australiensis]
MASGYAAVCDGHGFPDASAYAGQGPHPIGIAVRSAKGPGTGADADLTSDVAELPAEWRARVNTALQLVACVTVLDVVEVRRCEYRVIGSTTGNSLFETRLSNRVLRVEVRSARTGKPVSDAVEATTRTTTCAATAKQAAFGSDVNLNQFGTLTEAERDDLLRGLVTATV